MVEGLQCCKREDGRWIVGFRRESMESREGQKRVCLPGRREGEY